MAWMIIQHHELQIDFAWFFAAFGAMYTAVHTSQCCVNLTEMSPKGSFVRPQ
jgi:hypothetical protein